MRHLISTGCICAAVVLTMTGDVLGGDDCIVSNGDLETGDLAPWLPADELIVIPSEDAGDLGLPDGYDIGAFCLTGRLGEPSETAGQTIDLSAYAASIDAGCFSCTLSGALQSRNLSGLSDLVTCSFSFQDSGGAVLQNISFGDTSIPNGVYDWSLFAQTVSPPALTRQVRVEILMTRNGGSSTDAFADNICISVPSESCPPDVDGSGAVDVNDLLTLLAAWGPYEGPCGVDVIADGVVDVNDLLALLAAWGPCV